MIASKARVTLLVCPLSWTLVSFNIVYFYTSYSFQLFSFDHNFIIYFISMFGPIFFLKIFFLYKYHMKEGVGVQKKSKLKDLHCP